MGMTLPDYFDFDAVDPDNPTLEQITALAGGVAIKILSYQKNPARFRTDLALAKAEIETAKAQAAIDPEDIPHPEIHRHDGDAELDRIVEQIGVVAAYRKWINKSEISSRDEGRPESVKVSCPIPGHVDSHPSAWLAPKNDTWYCGTCATGGDKYDLAAIGLGFKAPDYKTDGNFPELRRQMAAEFGYSVKREKGKTVIKEMQTVYEEDEPEPEPAAPLQPVPELPTLTTSDDAPTGKAKIKPLKMVNPLDFGLPDPTEGMYLPEVVSPLEAVAEPVELHPQTDTTWDPMQAKLDWEAIIPEDTFLGEYMIQNCRFDIPHEYHFWMAVQLLSFAIGFNISLQDVPSITPQWYVVLVGQTGMGKSRSVGPMKRLMREVMPWTGTKDTKGTGVKILGGLESGQALIQGISHEYEDPASSIPGQMIRQANVTGWTMPEEFAGFVKKAMRTGSDFKERAIEFFDVSKDGVVSTTSIRAGGEIAAHGPFLQITSTTQPDAIHTYLTAEDGVSGFLNRFIFVSGPSRDVRPSRWTLADAPDLTRAAAALRAIMQFVEANDGLEMEYTPDASVAWEALFAHIEGVKVNVGAMSVRLDLYIKKLMLVFAVNEHKTEIDSSIVERMYPVVDHLMANFNRVQGELHWRSDDDCQNAILEYIVKKNKRKAHPTKKEIVDAIKRPMLGRSRFDIMRALDLLEKLDMINLVKVEKKDDTKRGPVRLGYLISGLGLERAGGAS